VTLIECEEFMDGLHILTKQL